MIAGLRKIRAKVRFFRELSEKCAKKAAIRLTSQTFSSRARLNTALG